MKKSELTFGVLQLPIDLITIILAFSLAYFLRVKFEIPQSTIYAWPFYQYIKFIIVFLPFWIIIFGLEGLYNIRKPKQGLKEFSSIFLGVSAGIAVIFAWLFFSRFLFFSRLIILYAWVLAIIFVYLGRYFLKSLQKLLYRKGIGLHRVLVIGVSESAKKITNVIRTNPGYGFKLVKAINKDGVEKLMTIFNRNKFDEVILADPNLSERETGKILDFCEENKLYFKMMPNLFRAKSSNVEISSLSTYPLLEFKRTPLEGWGKVAKRVIDIIVSLIGLIICLPVFIVVSIITRIDSRGLIFYKQKRIGSGGKEFYLYKLRSMIEEADSYYHKFKKKNRLFRGKIKEDPRITKFGRFLRVSCIDELPQLYNVLKGEMSLVGPRPLTPDEFNRVSSYEKKYTYTSYIKPGMTGLWQVSGRMELSDLERLSLDIYYVESWSLLLDILIVLKTPVAVIKSRRNY
ncbi:MAG: sugar transferase [Candidatus Berkelbacteria bacterium]|nr:sugar transferase [Candidatus Berkelbacteria bacterium]